MTRKKNLIKIILTDTAGVLCLLLVPLLGPVPGPGGIPLLLAGLGLLAINHDWADNWLKYAKKHSDSLRTILFPNISWVKWIWDIFAFSVLLGGTWMNFVAVGWFLQGMSIAIMASSTTIFIMNRGRIIWLDEKIRPGSHRSK